MKANRTFFIRHGSYEYGTGYLTDVGRNQSEDAAKSLIELGLGSTALIHSSNHVRAIQTAEIIASVLADGTFSADEITALAGEYPDGVKDLDATIDAALQKQEIDPTGRDLVVVTHQPLVAFLEHGDPYEPVANCFIHEYRGHWNASIYRNGPFAMMLAELL